MKKGHSITFRGKAARLAFEAITGTKLSPVERKITKPTLDQKIANECEGATQRWEKLPP